MHSDRNQSKQGGVLKIPEIRFTITEKLDKLVSKLSKELKDVKVARAEHTRSQIQDSLRDDAPSIRGGKR